MNRLPLRTTRRDWMLTAAAAIGLPALAAESVDAFPTRTVTLVLPFPSGGVGDATLRLIAKELSGAWKVPVIVESKPGASGMIGSAAVARAAPDGYTILFGVNQMVQAPALYARLPYDVLKDFTPLTRLAYTPVVFVTNDPEISSLQNYAERAARAPKKYSYGSYGGGTTSHILGAVFNQRNGIDAVHIPYKGGAPLMTDLLGGHVSMAFADLATALPHLQAGKLRAYAVTGSRRSAAVPDVPTFAELGYPGFDVQAWYGTFLPAQAAPALATKIRDAIERALFAPEMQQRLSAFALEPLAAREDFDAKLRADLAYWKRLVAEVGIKVED